MKTIARHVIVAMVIAACGAVALIDAQQQSGLTAAEKQRRWDFENELQSVAVVDRKVMMPMADGVRLATDIYRPKNATGKVPIIWVRTPYNFNFWDIQNGVPADMTAALTAVKRGYKALAITDECSLAGMVRAHVAAREHKDKFKLIVGAEFRLEDGLRFVLIEEMVRYAAPNGQRLHHHVVRDFPGGVNGFALPEKTAKKTVTVGLNQLRDNSATGHQVHHGQMRRLNQPAPQLPT